MLIRSYCAALSFIVAAALFSSVFAFLPPPTPPPPTPKVTQFKPYFHAIFHHLVAVVLPSAALCFGAVPPQPANAFGEDIAAKVQKSLNEDTTKKYTEDGMDLVETLKRRTIQNKAKNDRILMEKTFLNSEAGIYGPFDKFIPVMKKDGQYVLLTEDQYNTLKGEGKIVGRDFVVDYQAESAPAAVEAPVIEEEDKKATSTGSSSQKTLEEDDADLFEDGDAV
ncbi:hypothetical protein Naga_100138g7 [Nannochloropsis gaditana]|uniref:Uncharacterized protein n=1 Tax=Nannochloropsis gaditana TaxID=72520 RepID=W7U3W7_9STRA|nr:hypothetical protein Naga_100138g7 [Nannochloropsis gaditana]